MGAVRREAIAWLLAALLIYLVYLVVQPFLNALVWAAIIAAFFSPVHRWIGRRVPRPALAALLSLLFVAVVLIVPTWWVGSAFVKEAVETVGKIPARELAGSVTQWLESVSSRIPAAIGDLDEMLIEAIRTVRGKIGQWSAALAGNIAAFVIDTVIMLLTLFFLFRDGPKILELLRGVSPFTGERHDRIAQEATQMVTVTVTASFVVAVTQGFLGGVAFAIVGVPSPVFWGVVMAFFSIIPVVGTWMIWLPWAIFLLVEGETARGVGLLAMGGLVISTIDHVLRSILIAGRSRMNALLVFLGVLGGIGAFGVLGIVLGPLLLSAGVGVLTGYRDSLAAERNLEPQEAGGG